jgi:hypothetical protein
MKNWIRRLISIFLIFWGCSDKPSVLPNILSETEEGFADMVFAVIAQEQLPSGEFKIEIASKAGNDEVALRVILGRDWKEGTLGGQIKTFQGIVTIQRLDDRSDKFIQFMDKAYATAVNPTGMKDSAQFTGITLAGDPRRLQKGEVKIKLFFESEKDEEYAEAYLNLDLTQRKAWFNEKDPGYRASLVNDIKK